MRSQIIMASYTYSRDKQLTRLERPSCKAYNASRIDMGLIKKLPPTYISIYPRPCVEHLSNIHRRKNAKDQ